MIYDKLVRAAQRVMQEIEAVCDPTSGHPPLADEKNPWHDDYNALKAAVDELENDLGRDGYFAVVASAGDEIIVNLDGNPDAEYDLETQFTQQLHDLENQHPWVLSDEKSQLILVYSNYPCQEPASFGQNGCLKHVKGSDAFPWRAFAAMALAEDVKTYLNEQYDLDVINNETLLAHVQ